MTEQQDGNIAARGVSDWPLTLIAFCCYLATGALLWRSMDSSEAMRTDNILFFAGVMVVLAWLAARLITKRAKPWSGLSRTAVILYAVGLGLAGINYGMLSHVGASQILSADIKALAEMRSRLTEYRARHGVPTGFSNVMAAPVLQLPRDIHPRTSEVRVSSFTDIRDSGRWLYVASSSATVLIDCTHLNQRGLPWSSY